MFWYNNIYSQENFKVLQEFLPKVTSQQVRIRFLETIFFPPSINLKSTAELQKGGGFFFFFNFGCFCC